jgi:hypothetical protein
MRSRIERLSVLLLLELLLHLSFISRKAIAFMFFSTFLALNLIVWFSTLLLVPFLKLFESPLFHLFLNLHSGSKLTNTITEKFSQSPTKHYLASPPLYLQSSPYPIRHLHSFFYSTVTFKRPAVSSRLKITDRSFIHHAPVPENALPK